MKICLERRVKESGADLLGSPLPLVHRSSSTLAQYPDAHHAWSKVSGLSAQPDTSSNSALSLAVSRLQVKNGDLPPFFFSKVFETRVPRLSFSPRASAARVARPPHPHSHHPAKLQLPHTGQEPEPWSPRPALGCGQPFGRSFPSLGNLGNTPVWSASTPASVGLGEWGSGLGLGSAPAFGLLGHRMKG